MRLEIGTLNTNLLPFHSIFPDLSIFELNRIDRLERLELEKLKVIKPDEEDTEDNILQIEVLD